MTRDEEIEIAYLLNDAKRIGLHIMPHRDRDLSFYVMEHKCFPGRKYQAKPPSLARFLTLDQAAAFVRDYRAAFPKGRTDE